MPENRIARRRFLGGVAAAQLAIEARAAGQPAKMKLAIGADHAGFPLKGPLAETLKSWGHTVTDCGTYSPEPVDFPDIARKLCGEVLAGRADRGIMVCGTGVGASIAANKISGIRAALCHDTYCGHQGVEHDNVNVICMGAWIVGPRLAEEILSAFLNAKFTAGDQDFQRRVKKLEELEKGK
jgi:ribose 5-phosphate isomerase B